MKLAMNLKLLRITHEITQDELSRKIGVSIQSINKWENGKCFPDIYNLIKLADYYDISIECITKKEFSIK